MKSKRNMDALDLTAFFNGLVFFAPVSLLVRTGAGVTLERFFLLQALLSASVFLLELPGGRLTDRIGYKATLLLYQVLLLLARLCLLAAYTARSWPLFVLEAVVEGAALSFASGTQSAYIYLAYPPERYASKSAHLANCSTLGFFVSTAAYALLYTLGGIELLLWGTAASHLAALTACLRIPREAERPQPRPARSGAGPDCRRLLRTGRVAGLVLALAGLNIGRILINFFYAEKLRQCGIGETWLTAIILGYSAVELPAEWLLAHTRRARYSRLLALFFVLSGAALAALGALRAPALVVLCMLALPFALDVPSYLLGELQNHVVDDAGRQDSRAECLSLFNMGVNFSEVFFLLGSSAVSGAGSACCFALLGAFMAGAGALCFVKRDEIVFSE